MPTNKLTTVSPKQARLDTAHMATSMYSERVSQDDNIALYATNPDARQFYFKGIHDLLTVLEVWREDKIEPALLDIFLTALLDQTAEATSTQ